MKTLRKTPFAQGAIHKAPGKRVKNPFGHIVSEDPTFMDINASSSSFMTQETTAEISTTTSIEGTHPQTVSGNRWGKAPNPFSDFDQTPAFTDNHWGPDWRQEAKEFQPHQALKAREDYQVKQSDVRPVRSATSKVWELEEPPLLEDLGIDLGQIKRKILSIVGFKQINKEIVEDADLAGPLMIVIILGTILLLQGKFHFKYIYGYGLTGSLCVFGLLRYSLGPSHTLSLYTVMSVLGYCLVPFTVLAVVAAFTPMDNLYGAVMSVGIVCWSTLAATKFIVGTLMVPNKKVLVGVSVLAFYSCFLLATLF